MKQLIRIALFLIGGVALVVAKPAGDDHVDVHITPEENSFHASVNLKTSDVNYDLHLKKPSSGHASVLSDDIQILEAESVGSDGQVQYKRWQPSKEELDSAQSLYIDANSNSVFKIHKNIENGEYHLNGIMDGTSINHNGEEHIATFANNNDRTDFIDLGRNLTPVLTTRQSTRVNAVVELVIVCDKEFSDKFGQNRQRILDFWTIYMWDINMRYKTLTSDSLSFRVNGIIIISSTSGQPFIEDARGPDGRAEFGRILEKYSYWVYNQINSWPAFDMAPLVTNTALEWGGGLAYMNAACWVDNNSRRHLGTSVWNDAGDWGSLTVGAHELGHNLGAPHDDDPNFPGGCSERGYIMGGGNDNLRWLFSSCSDRTMSSFVRSDGASCLRSNGGSPILDPNYGSPAAPTMADQCKTRTNNPNAYIEAQDTYNCKTMRCLSPVGGGTIWIQYLAPVDNTLCGGGGRCFRGQCRVTGHFFKNVGSGLCMRAQNPFNFYSLHEMIPCPQPGTPLDRLIVRVVNPSIGTTLRSPFNLGEESGDKCAYTGNAEGNPIATDRCGDGTNPWHGWELRDVGNGQFLLVHKVTGRCAKPETRSSGSIIRTYGACNSNDVDMKWTRYL